MLFDEFYVKYKKMIFTKNDEIDFDNAKICLFVKKNLILKEKRE